MRRSASSRELLLLHLRVFFYLSSSYRITQRCDLTGSKVARTASEGREREKESIVKIAADRISKDISNVVSLNVTRADHSRATARVAITVISQIYRVG